MRVLLVSEGKHELRLDNPPGALGILVQRLLATESEFDYRTVRDRSVHVHRRPGKGDGMVKLAHRWMRLAEQERFDALVLVVDEDGDRSRIKQFDQAQESLEFTVRRALGIAVPMFDAWMLADETAWNKAMGIAISRQPDPESIADPKARCSELMAESAHCPSPADAYASISAMIVLNVLHLRCPRGFAPFGRRVANLPAS